MKSAQPVEGALWAALLVASSGGFLDGFTYVGHGHVFANAMTGNLVLLGVALVSGTYSEVVRRFEPILAYGLGVLAAEAFERRSSRAGNATLTPQVYLTALGCEIALLVAGGFFPQQVGGSVLVLSISFLAAVQSSIFQKIGKWSYNSTVATGNFRNFSEALFRRLLNFEDETARERIVIYGSVTAAFLAGAMAGGWCTARLGNRALWLVSSVLIIVWLRLLAEVRRTGAAAIQD